MEVEVKNPANSPMHYGEQPLVKTLEVPDRLPSRLLYSGIEARKQFEQLEHDVYEGINKTKKKDRRKFPAVLKWVFGLGTVAAGVVFRKPIWNSLKGLFKKAPKPPTP